MRVLLIEDDSATAQSIELMLKSAGFNVYTTDLGEEGIDLSKVYDHDIILLDLNLPDMSGFERRQWQCNRTDLQTRYGRAWRSRGDPNPEAVLAPFNSQITDRPAHFGGHPHCLISSMTGIDYKSRW
jgi:hypothetical protein